MDFTINMSRLTALPHFSARFFTKTKQFQKSNQRFALIRKSPHPHLLPAGEGAGAQSARAFRLYLSPALSHRERRTRSASEGKRVGMGETESSARFNHIPGARYVELERDAWTINRAFSAAIYHGTKILGRCPRLK